ncbi:unnamed protein product [Amaranthus hypochondriacus]
MRVDSAAYHLIEDADIWWIDNRDSLTAKITYDEKGFEEVEKKEFGWKEFKKALRAEFFPPHMRKRKRSEFEQLEQGDMSVQDFYTKYLELCRFVPELVPNEQERALRFEEKLNIELLSNMGATDFTTLNEVYTRASNAERIAERRKGVEKGKVPIKENIQQSDKGNTFSQNKIRSFDNRGPRDNFSRGSQSQQAPRSAQSSFHPCSQAQSQLQSQSNSGPVRRYICKRCENNHPGRDCEGNKVTCNYCKKERHRAYECFTNPVAKVERNYEVLRRPTSIASNRPTTITTLSRTTGTANTVHAKRGPEKKNTGNLNHLK